MSEADRKRKREKIARPPEPGFFGGLGRGIGNITRAVGEGEMRRMEAEQLKADAMRRSLATAGSAVAGAGRRFAEGVSSGVSGREYDPARAQPAPDNGKEQSADEQGPQGMGPPAPVLPAPPRGRMGPPSPMDEIATPRRPVLEQPELPPVSLTHSGGNTFRTQPAFNPQEDAIPEGYVEIIRGTDRTYQGLDDRGSTFGQREFRALPGMSLDEAARSAAAEAPGFQFLREADIDEKRADATLLNAEANQLNAVFGNIQTATDAQGAPMLMLPREDGSGYDRVEDVFPVITGLGDDTDRYELSEVTVDGMPQSVVVDLTGQTPDRNISDEQAMAFAVRRARAIAQQEFGGDLSQMTNDDWFDIFDDMAVGENVKDALYNSLSQ